MRLGIEITPVSITPTGVGYYVRHLLDALLALPDPPVCLGFASGVHELDRSAITIPYRRLPLPTRLLYKCWDRLGYPRVDSFIGGADVYHAVNYVLPPTTSARRVLSIHDLCFLRHPEWASPKITAPFQKTIRRHAHAADAVIACSEATKRDIIELLDVPEERVRVIYDAADALFHPVDREQAAQQVKTALRISTPYLLFVGTREPRKNLSTLLAAYARARISQQLVIVGGDGWNSHALLEQADALGIQDKILFTGYLRRRELFPALYSAADAFVFPSHYEGFGLPVIEAMACGCPVIASNTTSLPEVGGDAALYAAPDDADAFAALIRRVAADAGLRTTMRAKSLEQAQRFSWRRCAEETVACYRSVL